MAGQLVVAGQLVIADQTGQSWPTFLIFQHQNN
jgi:hypothetical protein